MTPWRSWPSSGPGTPTSSGSTCAPATGERTVIGYDVARGGIYVDRTKSGNVGFNTTFPSVEFAPLNQVRTARSPLRILVDRSSVEVFADDGESPSPTRSSRSEQRQDPALLHRRPGPAAELTIWQLKSAWR